MRSAEGAAVAVRVSAPVIEGVRTEVIERAVTADDLPNLSNLALKDFAIDFKAEAPVLTGDPAIDEARLNDYADQLCRDAGIPV